MIADAPFQPGDRVTVASRYPYTASRSMKGKIHRVERCRLIDGAAPGNAFALRVWLTGLSCRATPDGSFAADDFNLVARLEVVS